MECFDEKYGQINTELILVERGWRDGDRYKAVRNDIKSFISSLLLQKDEQRKKEVEEAIEQQAKIREIAINGLITDANTARKEEQQRILAIIDEKIFHADAVGNYDTSYTLIGLKSAILPTKS